MPHTFPIEKFSKLETPFYYYDVALFQKTLDTIAQNASKYNYQIHFAVKANANSKLLGLVRDMGFGADCVSGNEVRKVSELGISADKIAFAGVGKTDKEINLGLDLGIFSFNVESIPELEVINELAGLKNKVAKISLRLNPNVNAHTHHYITTGLEENKFGINLWDIEKVVGVIATLKNVELTGIHFHIGSQITELQPFVDLCVRVNEIQKKFESLNVSLKHINLGGGLGVSYKQPEAEPIPQFEKYFETIHKHLEVRAHQTVHFEIGRAMVAQCGSLVTRTVFVKEGVKTKFAIVDAGMSDLIRPALYQAYHKIENISSDKPVTLYDVVGPICESSDCFGKAVEMNETKRGDLIAIRTAGAYGEVMASQYNLRNIPASYFSDEV